MSIKKNSLLGFLATVVAAYPADQPVKLLAFSLRLIPNANTMHTFVAGPLYLIHFDLILTSGRMDSLHIRFDNWAMMSGAASTRPHVFSTVSHTSE